MREIKFRAWHKVLEEMRYDPWVSCSGSEDYQINDAFNKENSLQEYIWMQYTGLKDKNGKEIYEGDIVRQRIKEDEEHLWDCVIEYSGAHFRGKNFKGGYCSIDYENFVSEIIGNIYSNPELLK